MVVWILVLLCRIFFFFFKQKTAYEMRISDWSSDVCSSDLRQSLCLGLGGGADLLPAVHPDERRRPARLPHRQFQRRKLDALVRRASVAAKRDRNCPRAAHRDLCLGDGRVRAALLEPHASRYPDPRPL